MTVRQAVILTAALAWVAAVACFVGYVHGRFVGRQDGFDEAAQLVVDVCATQGVTFPTPTP